MSTDKDGSPSCGIYVRIDDFSNMLDLIGHVRQFAFAINRGSGYAKNMAVVELVYKAEYAERIADIVPIIRQNGLVAIISGARELYGADGILVDDLTDIDTARGALDDDAIIGAVCDNKDQAEQAIAAKVDYISAPADPALISWVSAKSDVLCLARGKRITPQTCPVLVDSGADLIDTTTYIFGHEKGVMQGTVNIMDAIDRANDVPVKVN